MSALRRGTSASGVRGIVVALVAVVAMVMTCVSGILPVARAEGQTVDLTATLEGLQSSAPAGSDFEARVILRNISSAPAQNAAFSLQFKDRFSAVHIEQVSAEGGAEGPATIQLTAEDDHLNGLSSVYNKAARATVNLPANSTLVYKVTGRYPFMPSGSVDVSIQPQAGDTDSEPSSNTAQQQVSLDTKSDVSIDVHQDKEQTQSGEIRRYTVTYTNRGPATIVDAEATAGLEFGVSRSRDSNVSVKVLRKNFSCTPTGKAQCVSESELNGLAHNMENRVKLYDSNVSIPSGDSLTYEFSYEMQTTASEKEAEQLSVPVTFKAGLLTSTLMEKKVEGAIVGASTILSDKATVTLHMDPVKTPVNSGDKVRYTFSLTNDEGVDLPNLRFPISVDGPSNVTFAPGAQYSLSCVGEGGAVCPETADGKTRSMSDWRGLPGGIFDFVSPDSSMNLPVHGKLAFTIEFDADFGSCIPAKFTGFGFYYQELSQKGVALTVKEEVPEYKDRNVDVLGTRCTVANTDIRVVKSTDSQPVYSGKEHTYVVRYENHGDTAVNGIKIAKYLSLVAKYSADYVTTCTTEGNAVCPSGYPLKNGTGYWEHKYYEMVYPTRSGTEQSIDIAAHSALVFTTKAVVTVDCPANGSYPMKLITFTQMPDNTRNATEYRGNDDISSTISCNDVSSQTNLLRDGRSVSQTDPDTNLTVVSRISNSVGTAENVAVQVQTPARTFVASADAQPSCRVVSGDAVCPTDLKWDAAKKLITGTVPRLAAAGALEVSLVGKSGVVPTTVDSGAFTTSTVSEGDTTGTNSSQATISYANEKVPVTLTQRIEGLSAQGAPADVEFTGVLSCATQDDVPVTLRVKKGQSEASKTVNVWKHSDCTLTMQAPVSAPQGYAWESTDPAPAQISDVEDGASLMVSRRVRALVVPADITVRYVTVDAQDARRTVQSQKLEKNVGDSYETSALDVDGFKLAVTPDNAKGTISSADPVVVEYVYVPVDVKSTKPVAFGTRYVADPSVDYAKQVERTAGVNGEDTITTSYSLNAQGRIEAKDSTSRSKDPVERVVAVGNVEKKTIKRVIHYVDAENTSKQIHEDTTQSVNWQRTDTVNATTGVLSEGAWSTVTDADRSFPAVDAPEVKNYTNPSVKRVSAVRVLDTNPADADAVTIQYDHVKTPVDETRDVTRTIRYVDAVTGKSIDEKQNVSQKVTLKRTNVRDEVTGQVTPGKWSTEPLAAVESPVFAKYAAASVKEVAALHVNGDTASDNPVTVSYPQGTGTVKESKTVTREVTFIAKETGDQLGNPVEQRVELTRENTVNLVTGEVVTSGTWSTGDLPAVAALTISGYTPLSQGAAELTVTGDEASALRVAVEYEKTPDQPQAQIRTQPKDEPKSWAETRPAGTQKTRVSTLARTGTDIQFISLMVLLATAAGIALTVRKSRA
ncbi:mucin-binding protein [Alloscardovia macacae]|uniref:MucBP domain family protein n=1 Tax=Alloscardovia macacae TaxID=1160091 RepID=A0A261F556_9BIFI|nr:MucBP domain-containing protein [Alloscardovia macacae]OZG54228.1 MucBP domain family protein [Alloscardovia macacae]